MEINLKDKEGVNNMLKRLGKRAQTTAEYAILIALVVGAVMAMQIYVRRGLQGRVKEVVDHTGAGGSVGGASLNFSGNQYEPYYLSSTGSTNQASTDTENMRRGGSVVRTTNGATTAERNQVVGWRDQ